MNILVVNVGIFINYADCYVIYIKS